MLLAWKLKKEIDSLVFLCVCSCSCHVFPPLFLFSNPSIVFISLFSLSLSSTPWLQSSLPPTQPPCFHLHPLSIFPALRSLSPSLPFQTVLHCQATWLRLSAFCCLSAGGTVIKLVSGRCGSHCHMLFASPLLTPFSISLQPSRPALLTPLPSPTLFQGPLLLFLLSHLSAFSSPFRPALTRNRAPWLVSHVCLSLSGFLANGTFRNMMKKSSNRRHPS